MKTEVRQLIQAGRRLADSGLIAGFAGNLSARDSSGDVVATASGVRKGELSGGDFCTIRRKHGEWQIPENVSSEIAIHLAIYDASDAARSVVHAHPKHATALCALERLPSFNVTAEGAAILGPIAVVPYVRPGTPGLGESVRTVAGKHRTMLLRNHGAVVWSSSIDDACARMECLEYVAEIVTVQRLLGIERGRLSSAEAAVLWQAYIAKTG